ncbi:MAG: DegT/DnrJ/EryC1/StrS family aminotransferase, partial [Nitrospira sp.]|nr:DegT/DnrJ/EryC1/StrS family aminotransferase [Nitrospira sp.]
DMDMIIQIAKKHDLYIVEDAAHAPGAVFNGKKAGTIGDVGCFSFFSNKNMTTGEGGMIVTDNDDLADKLKLIRSHGMTSLTMDRHKGHAYSYDVIDFGFNYRMDEIRAAMGIVQLKKLKKNIELRQIIVKLYRKKLNGIKEIKIPFDNYSQESSYHIFPIILSLGINRKKFIDMMREKGIQTSIHYPPVHLFSFYRDKFGFEKGMLPVTEEVCNREVTLPLYPHMDTEAIDYIAGAIDSIIRSKEAVRLD